MITTRSRAMAGTLALAASGLITILARTTSAQAVVPPEAPALTAEPAAPAIAARPAALPTWPQVGGHWGFALPIVSVTNVGTTVIGRDFVNFGISPGVTVKLAPHWAIDFEFVAYGRWNRARGTTPESSGTSFVLDPGVIWTPGPIALGLRGAIQVGEQIPFNIGIIPIIVKTVPMSTRVSWLFELDLPVFVSVGVQQTVVNFGPQLQTGVAF